MLPALPDDLVEAQALGISLVAGEAEDHLDEILQAAHERRLPPVYNFMRNLPALEAHPCLRCRCVTRGAISAT